MSTMKLPEYHYNYNRHKYFIIIQNIGTIRTGLKIYKIRNFPT